MASPTSKTYDWKILCLGRGVAVAKEAGEHMRSLGYKNVVVDGSVENNAEGDEKMIALLKQTNWDAVSIGMGFYFRFYFGKKKSRCFSLKYRWRTHWL